MGVWKGKIMKVERKKSSKKINGLWIYGFSFLIPLAILILLFRETHIYPFGDYCFLADDARAQYLQFLKGFREKLVKGSSFDYSWQVGLGSGYGAMYAYYLSSPLNFLVRWVSPDHMVDLIQILILVKLSLCGVTFAHYLRRHFGSDSVTVVVMAICYALSSYMVQYCCNIIWLDCFVLFPLIVLGLEKLVAEQKPELYFFTLAISILSNYYLSIIICIFLVLYFALVVLTAEEPLTRMEKWSAVKNFVLYSALAGGTAAIVLLPAIATLRATEAGQVSFPHAIELYSSLSQLAIRPLICVPKSGTDYFPNLYCSVLALFLVQMYLLNPVIYRKRKLGNLLFAAFMLLSFEVNLLDYIWHGFHFTNCIFARNSFIFIFLVLVMSCEALLRLQELPERQFVISIVLVTAYLFLMKYVKIGKTDAIKIGKTYIFEYYSERIFYLSLIFGLVYLLALFGLKSMKRFHTLIRILLLLVVSYELYMNGGTGVYATCTRSELINDQEAIRTLTERTKKEENGGFFRVEKENRRTANDAEGENYQGATSFTSTAQAGVVDFYKIMGMEQQVNYYAYYGHTPLMTAMLGVKYILSDQLLPESEEYEFVAKEDYVKEDYLHHDDAEGYKPGAGSVFLYKNRYALPLGYMISREAEEALHKPEENPFVNMNRLYQGITGSSEDMFHLLEVQTTENGGQLTVTETAGIYFMCNEGTFAIEADIIHQNGEVERKSFVYYAHYYISDLGELQKGDRVTFTILSEEDGDYRLYAAAYDPLALEKAYKTLEQSPMEVSSYGDTFVKGKVNAVQSGVLLFTIPYEKGWTAYIDGRKMALKAFGKAFLSLELEEGEHTVTLQYHMPGKFAGMVLSVLSVMGFVILRLKTCGFFRKFSK